VDPRIRIVTVGGSLIVLGLVVELVRRRKLKEEYSVLWVITALGLLALSIWYGLLARITDLIGGVAPSSTLFFFGLVFTFVLLLHYSVRISSLERRVTALVQEVGLLNVERAQPPEPEPNPQAREVAAHPADSVSRS
jgi:hypothetical protein